MLHQCFIMLPICHIKQIGYEGLWHCFNQLHTSNANKNHVIVVQLVHFTSFQCKNQFKVMIFSGWKNTCPLKQQGSQLKNLQGPAMNWWVFHPGCLKVSSKPLPATTWFFAHGLTHSIFCPVTCGRTRDARAPHVGKQDTLGNCWFVETWCVLWASDWANTVGGKRHAVQRLNLVVFYWCYKHII